MHINITNADITKAVTAYMAAEGFSKEVSSIEFTVGRRRAGDTSPPSVSAVVHFATNDDPAPVPVPVETPEDSPKVTVAGGSEDTPIVTPEKSNEETASVASAESIFTS